MVLRPVLAAERATHLDSCFTVTEDGRCRAELLHGGWDDRGDEAEQMQHCYDGGWDIVLAEFATSATTE
jgi:hypothetical protein